MSTPQAQIKVARHDLSRDLDSILALSKEKLEHLYGQTSSPSSSSPTTAAQSLPALQLLEDYNLAAADLEASQKLIGAYVRDMRKDVLAMDGSESERLGVRIDQVRARAEGLKEALDKVKV
ncbi:hypothetical protein BD324DRAFT_649397 [Kockovaella imperatae]|uniref:Uncharacterized protein n=1 Tax=Kockovaella imperatae TaxID=4999 RepID=A0A1Y1UMP2_9TREE|nr:hypothetical protein BD324DRAFT_649397 [Kockovaella imperatae]ORX39320.1 hypothetical protein BD324DRAFT_649397 [Kockovaella imperatae]